MTINRYSFKFDGPFGIILTTPQIGVEVQDLPVKYFNKYFIDVYTAIRLRDELNQAIKEYEQAKKETTL